MFGGHFKASSLVMAFMQRVPNVRFAMLSVKVFAMPILSPKGGRDMEDPWHGLDHSQGMQR
jgi:hypothetical protein